MFGAHSQDLEAMFAPDLSDLFAPPPGVTVSLQGLDFVSGSRARSRISLGAWDGWTNGPARSGGPQSWALARGGYASAVYEDVRRIRLEGLIVEPYETALWQRMEELGSILGNSTYATMRVDEPHLQLSRQIQVTRLAKPMITPLSNRIASYTLELEATDYPRLDVEQQSVAIPAGGVDLTNIGTHDAELTLQIDGPRTQTTLTGPWGSWEYRASIPDGSTRLVDMRRRLIRDPATSGHSRADAGGDWLSLPPGTTQVALSGSGTGGVTAMWRSTWP